VGYLYLHRVMYRAVAYVALNVYLPNDEAAITTLARVMVEVLPPTVPTAGTDVLADVLTSRGVSAAGTSSRLSHPYSLRGIREALRLSQRNVGLAGRVVMVGRDIGTVVLRRRNSDLS